jgi:hypothetical protein
VVLARLPTLDESGVVIRQTVGREPYRGSIFPVFRSEAPILPMWAPELLLRRPVLRTRVRGLRAAPPPRVLPGVRRE